MRGYIVSYVVEGDEDDNLFFFPCQADDAEHAREQCLNAYSDAEIISVEITIERVM